MKYLLILVFGGIGSLARYLATIAVTAKWGARFPYGTVLVNLSGCFMIGLAMTFLATRTAHPNWRLALVVGFLGGYTTFSGFEWENYTAQSFWLGAANVVGSVTLGYAAVWVGAMLARR